MTGVGQFQRLFPNSESFDRKVSSQSKQNGSPPNYVTRSIFVIAEQPRGGACSG